MTAKAENDAFDNTENAGYVGKKTMNVLVYQPNKYFQNNTSI